ncbi:hypothetical protein ACLKMY_20740 [Paraburkholderia mimosarum]|uniref:hypothetical protein n=1 Tax=Paraburkholderia mimosarum TaxID=312026 RepID=UPI0039C1C76D
MSSLLAPTDLSSKQSRGRNSMPARAALGVLGLAAIVAFWWLAVAALVRHNVLAAQFGPLAAWRALPDLISEDRLFAHICASLRRIGVGLACAIALGVPLGFVIGRIRAIEAARSLYRRFGAHPMLD